ncbi:MAG: hypothetical protein WDO16_20860 [Bacteroidota bacterium]
MISLYGERSKVSAPFHMRGTLHWDPGKIGGALKTGAYRQAIAGVTYILQ